MTEWFYAHFNMSLHLVYKLSMANSHLAVCLRQTQLAKLFISPESPPACTVINPCMVGLYVDLWVGHFSTLYSVAVNYAVLDQLRRENRR